MPYEYKLKRLVEFAETDMAGIVHFSNFFRFMEAAEHAFFRSMGFSIHTHGAEGTVGWPRVSATCEYLRPLRFEDEVEIHLLVAEVRNRSIRYQYVFRNAADGTELARGQVATVCTTVDQKTGKLMAIPIPEPMRAQITAAPAELLKGTAPAT